MRRSLPTLLLLLSLAGCLSDTPSPCPTLDPLPVYEATLGPEQSPPLQFDAPGPVVIGAARRVYVADRGNHRIQVLDTQGRFLYLLGRTGRAGGGFGNLVDLAVNATGGIYALDRQTASVHQYTPDGDLVRIMQGNSPTAFRLRDPVAVAVDARNHVWVASHGGPLLVEFDDTGELVGRLSAAGVSSLEDAGMRMDSRGYFWMLTRSPQRLAVWKAGEAAQVHAVANVRALSLDPIGIAWLLDGAAGQIVRQYSNGAPAGDPIPLPAGVLRAEALGGLAWEPRGVIHVTQNGPDAYVRLDEAGDVQVRAGTTATNDGEAHAPQRVAAGREGRFFVLEEAGVLKALSSEGVLWTRAVSEFGLPEYYRPTDLAGLPDGSLLVLLDGPSDQLLYLSPDGQRLEMRAIPAASGAPSTSHCGLDALADGTVYVFACGGYHVTILPAGGAAPRFLTFEGPPDADFSAPRSLAAGPEGTLLALNSDGSSLQQYSDRGRLLDTVSIPPSERAGWRATRHMAVAPNGTVAINDLPGNRVVMLYDAGRIARSFGTPGVGPEGFGAPADVALDDRMHLLVADQANDRVQLFSLCGR